MPYTMQQIIDRGRFPLNDTDKVRWTDADLLGHANYAIRLLRLKRPDLFFGQFTALPGDKALGDTFPLDDDYAPAVADYVTARAMAIDAEHVEEGKALSFFALFKDGAGA